MAAETPQLKFHEISKLAGHQRRRKRVGRGRGSGSGKTSGRGQKGQGARSGTRQAYRFEGGQTPLMKRSPKLGGFSNFRFRTVYEPVNVGSLEVFTSGSTVRAEELNERGLAHGILYKVLGDGELSKNLTVHAPKFSKSAIVKIEAAGGKAVVAGAQDSGGGDTQ